MSVWRVRSKVGERNVLHDVFLKDDKNKIIGLDEKTFSANSGNLPVPGDLVWTQDAGSTGIYADFYLGEIPTDSKWDVPKKKEFRDAGIARVCSCNLAKLNQSDFQVAGVADRIESFMATYGQKIYGEDQFLYEVPENEHLAKDFRKIWEKRIKTPIKGRKRA